MIKIKNWSSYQSYKDRKPPWIRFHKTMLDNYEYHSMSAEARALLPMLWLLASEDKDPVSGLIRDDYKRITFRLRMDLKVFEKALGEIIENNFVIAIQDPQAIENKECNQSVTNPLHIRNQSVTPETETETEYKKRGEISLEELNIHHIEDWLKGKRESGKYLTIDEYELLEKFKDYCLSKKPKYKDYVAAFRNSFKWENVPRNGGNNEATSKTERAKAAIMRGYA